ncbi:MAG: hypothetical protein QOJ34_1891 [Pseudonocardiales bacterium]|jgi:hypothetical protein|nr:hypothetical protein [Pseudonocardiales bacterium]
MVRTWWNETYVGGAVADGLVVVAETDGELVGVAQRGRRGNDHVIYKLDVHPEHRTGDPRAATVWRVRPIPRP